MGNYLNCIEVTMTNLKRRSVRPHHPQIKIDIRGGEVEVDAAIAPLVTALSELPEIMTSSSCQGDVRDDAYEEAYVAFDPELGYGRIDVVNLLNSLQKRLRKSPCHATLNLLWILPEDLCPIGELRCDPDQIEMLSSLIHRFAEDWGRAL
jgi:hypothetical protein